MSTSMTHKQIAKELGVSAKTIQRTIKNVHHECPPKMSTSTMSTEDVHKGCPLDKTGLSIEDFTYHKTALHQYASIIQLQTAICQLEGQLKNKLTIAK